MTGGAPQGVPPRLTRFEGRAAFSTWLHRIVVNAALDRLRRHQSRRNHVVDDDERDLTPVDNVDEQTPERVAQSHETSAVVQDALARHCRPPTATCSCCASSRASRTAISQRLVSVAPSAR